MEPFSAFVGLIKDFRDVLVRHFYTIALIVGLLCLALIQSPDKVLEFFFISSLINIYKEPIGLASFVCLLIWIFGFLYRIWGWWSSRLQAKKDELTRKEILLNLTPVEWDKIFNYIGNSTQTFPFERLDGVMEGLQEKNLVYSVETTERSPYWSYNLQPWVYEMLVNDWELVTEGLKKVLGPHQFRYAKVGDILREHKGINNIITMYKNESTEQFQKLLDIRQEWIDKGFDKPPLDILLDENTNN